LVGARAFGQEVTLYMVETFVKLLCEREPQAAFDWLSKNEGRYPLDAALEACRARGIEDATAYLLERAGRVDEALDLLLKKPAMSAPQLEHSAMAAINLCVSFSQDQGHADTWFRVLDTFLDHAQNLPLRDDATKNKVIGLVVDAMLPYVSPDALLEKLSDSPSAKSLPAVKSMLESLHRQEFMFHVAMRSLREDQVVAFHRQRAIRVRGARFKKADLGSVRLDILRDEPPPSTADTGRLEPPHLLAEDDFEVIEACWEALNDPDPNKLSDAMIKGTRYQLRLYSPTAFVKQLPELTDAGLN
jgi:hypothetical protein